MATKSTPNKKSTIKPKSRNLSSSKLTKSRFNLWVATLIGAVVAGIGLYLIFFAKAAGSSCDAVTGGFICNINQAYNRSDSIQDAGSGEVAAKVTAGWTNWGVAFRAPNFAQNGALPVHRFYNATNTSHRLAVETSQTYINLKADSAHNVDEGIFFWAWKTAGQANTKPIYELNHQVSGVSDDYYKYIDYSPTSTDLTSGNFINGGIVFYAYAANYVAPPLTGTVSPTATPTPTRTPTPTATPPTAVSPQSFKIINAETILFRPYQDLSGAPPPTSESHEIISDRIPYENVHASEIQLTNINIIRAAAGLPTLLRSPCLDAAALEWSMTMAQENVLHHSPTPQDTINHEWSIITRHCDGTWTILAENVAYGPIHDTDQPAIDYTSGFLFDLFMKSPEHYANIVRDFNIDSRTHGPWIDPATNKPANVFAMVGIGSVRTNSLLWVTQMYVGCINICSAPFTTSSY